METWLDEIETALAIVDIVCEHRDDKYIELLERNDPDAPAARTALTHLKDARHALQKAYEAIP